MIRSYVRGLAAEVEGADPMTPSEQLYLLFEGAITASQLHGEPWPAEYARQAAEKLLSAPSLELRPTPKKAGPRETQLKGSARRGNRK